MPATWRAFAGGVAWLIYAGLKVPGLQDEATVLALLVFAALVLVPLAFDLNVDSDEPGGVTRGARWARALQLPAAGLLALACAARPGLVAAVLALPWVIFTGLLAVIGWQRAATGGWGRSPGRLCADAALLFAGMGGAGVLVDRAGWRPLNPDAVLVAAMAVHFHYAGLILPTLAGLVLRRYPDVRFAVTAGVGVVLGVPAVAVALLARQLGGGPELVGAAGCGLALSGMAIGILYVRMATEDFGSRLARGLWGVAGAALFFSMVLAALYAMRGFAKPFPWLDGPGMGALHGVVNAFGFGLCGVLGWQLARRAIAARKGDGASP